MDSTGKIIHLPTELYFALLQIIPRTTSRKECVYKIDCISHSYFIFHISYLKK
jgi:hypothetical protein